MEGYLKINYQDRFLFFIILIVIIFGNAILITDNLFCQIPNLNNDDILMINVSDSFKLNNKGALQLQIPLSDISQVFGKKKNNKD